MNTQLNGEPKVIFTEVSSKAIEILTKNGFYPRIVGYGPKPSVPRYEGAWWLDPVEEVHVYAKRGVEALKAGHVPMEGYIIAYELELVEVKEPEKKDEKTNSKISEV